MKFDLVIAHYKEDINWIVNLNYNLINNVFIYTKSDQIPCITTPKTCHSYLANVGRESHTYIWHCVNRWDEMCRGDTSDFIFFVQGSPHAMHANAINDWIEIVSKENLDYTYNFRISNPNEFLNNGRCSHWAGETKSAGCSVTEWRERHIIKEAPNLFPIFWNACFGVSSKLIIQSDLSKYVNLIQNELSSLNPECGHYCERLWYYIFNMNKSNSGKPENSYAFSGGHDGNSHYGTMKLKDDGTIGIYYHDNEVFWSSDGDSITLYDSKKNPTSILRKINEKEYSGPFLGQGPKSIHKLTRL